MTMNVKHPLEVLAEKVKVCILVRCIIDEEWRFSCPLLSQAQGPVYVMEEAGR